MKEMRNDLETQAYDVQSKMAQGELYFEYVTE